MLAREAAPLRSPGSVHGRRDEGRAGELGRHLRVIHLGNGFLVEAVAVPSCDNKGYVQKGAYARDAFTFHVEGDNQFGTVVFTCQSDSHRLSLRDPGILCMPFSYRDIR